MNCFTGKKMLQECFLVICGPQTTRESRCTHSPEASGRSHPILGVPLKGGDVDLLHPAHYCQGGPGMRRMRSGGSQLRSNLTEARGAPWVRARRDCAWTRVTVKEQQLEEAAGWGGPPCRVGLEWKQEPRRVTPPLGFPGSRN